jgi:predicted transcriptional regulator
LVKNRIQLIIFEQLPEQRKPDYNLWWCIKGLKYSEIFRTIIHKVEVGILGGFYLIQVNSKISLSHRSKIDILAEVLQVSGEGTKKTHIMYQCNLSFRQLNTYLEFLIEMGFLEKFSLKVENKDYQMFKTTIKGRDFVKAYHDLKTLLVQQL